MKQSILIKPVILVLLLSLSSCKIFKAITDVPKKYVSKPSWGNEESKINFKVIQPLNDLYTELEKIENLEYSDQSSERVEDIEVPVVAKTKNPLYNPKKWIKTRNPLYNNRKWLKACVFGACAKTKNPAYNPTKWIKTKNPAYSPNKWTSVTASIPTIKGYKIKAKVAGKIKFTTYDGNKFNFVVPIETSGNITLVTAIPFAPPIIRTPFDGKLNIEMDVSVDIDEDWCIKVNPNSKFSWTKKLNLDFSYGLGALEVDLTDLANPQIEKMLSDIEDDIKKSLDCQKLKNDVSKQWKTRVFDIDNVFKAIAIPKEIGLAQLQANKNEINIYGSIKTEVKVTDDVIDIPDAGSLPKLKIEQPENPSIKLSVPVEIPYNLLEKQLKDNYEKLPIGNENSALRGNVFIKNIELFPSGKDLGIKVKFKTKTNLGLTNVKAIAYFTGQLEHTKQTSDNSNDTLNKINKHFLKFKLSKLAFNEFGNGKDRAVLALGYNSIKKSIEDMDDINITNEIQQAEELLIKSLNELVIYLPNEVKTNDENLNFSESEVKIQNWAFSKKHLMLLLRAEASIRE